MKLVILAPVGVTVGGRPIPLRRAQRRAVLGFLLLHANRTVTVPELIDALWGTAAPATARTPVFAAVSAVRQALRAAGAEPVTSVHGGYRLVATRGTHAELMASTSRYARLFRLQASGYQEADGPLAGLDAGRGGNGSCFIAGDVP
jgi:DNA-binding SARP family transcriptional activator